MQFSTRLSVAAHILLCIAVTAGQTKTTSAFLAGSVGVNPVIVRNTLGQLKAAGLVRVEAGVGGASLARDPADITLLDVFQAVEPQEALFHFHEKPNPLCPVGRNVHAVLDRRLVSAAKALEDELASVTLRSLIDEMEARIGAEDDGTSAS
ncbi:MAG: Rrf2 family transcriptional regulator [Desulfovibrionaceae bacterium]|nr:Rrf2 family transcriptional regulator [Desulfovibrionaceae bacterium]